MAARCPGCKRDAVDLAWRITRANTRNGCVMATRVWAAVSPLSSPSSMPLAPRPCRTIDDGEDDCTQQGVRGISSAMRDKTSGMRVRTEN
eukprot:2292316-Pleurochrysis_carterae.AAC.1